MRLKIDMLETAGNMIKELSQEVDRRVMLSTDLNQILDINVVLSIPVLLEIIEILKGIEFYG